MAELFRLGVSAEAKNKIIPQIDQRRFLRFDEEERADLYCFATSLCARSNVPPKKATCESFVMEKSVKDGTMALMILSHLAMEGNIDKNIDAVGVKQRKELVGECLNPMANAGFYIMKEMMTKPDDVIITKLIAEMDEMYAEAVGASTDIELPVIRPESVGPRGR